MTEPVTVAVVTDYRLAVDDLQRVLGAHGDRVELVDVSTGGHEGRPVDITLYDTFGRPGLGVDALTSLVARPGAGRVVVYTASLPPSTAAVLASIGVAGCLSKAMPTPDLIRSIERIAGGQHIIALRGSGGSPQFRAAGLTLSYREAEVLVLLCRGLRNRAIAVAIHVGEETVKSHLKSIYRKLGVTSRGEAISIGFDTVARPVEATVGTLD